jgi:hypothetical protein
MGIEDYSKPFTSDYILKKAITYSKEWVIWFDFESFNLFLVNSSWHVKKYFIYFIIPSVLNLLVSYWLVVAK